MGVCSLAGRLSALDFQSCATLLLSDPDYGILTESTKPVLWSWDQSFPPRPLPLRPSFD
jgi:hypothetical protein